jgi:hypothetical protein
VLPVLRTRDSLHTPAQNYCVLSLITECLRHFPYNFGRLILLRLRGVRVSSKINRHLDLNEFLRCCSLRLKCRWLVLRLDLVFETVLYFQDATDVVQNLLYYHLQF